MCRIIIIPSHTVLGYPSENRPFSVDFECMEASPSDDHDNTSFKIRLITNRKIL
jgi:hypothetical protein